jgi:hypothetical protein
MNQIVNLVINMVFRRLLNKGMNAGINAATRRGQRDDDLTPEQQAELRRSQQRNRRMAQTARRIGRF